jgi:hypothetical protein
VRLKIWQPNIVQPAVDADRDPANFSAIQPSRRNCSQVRPGADHLKFPIGNGLAGNRNFLARRDKTCIKRLG